MAKLLLIALVLGIAGCTKAQEYVYDYETQVMSGLPEGSNIYSGLKLVTRVHFQMVSLTDARMEFRNPRLFRMNGPVDTYDPTREMLPTETFTELLDDDAINMKKYLTEPVSLSYVRGQVEDVRTAGSDPEWSVNIKKGFLSLMEVNFNERHTMDPHVTVTRPEAKQTMYRVFEPSLAGDCETTYRMLWNADVHGAYNMRMEKVRNFENCMERVMFTSDMLNGRPCEYCNVETALDTFTAESMVRYELLGSPDNYTIVSAVGESMYAYVPFTEQRGRLMTFTNQTMTLVEMIEETAERLVESPSSPQKHIRPLRAVKSPREDKLRTQPFLLEKAERAQLVQKAMKVLTGIANMNEKKIDMTSDDFIKEMWRLLNAMDQPGLTQLMEEAMKKTTLPKTAWKTLVDLLPTVGTFESVDVLLTWMETNKPLPDTALITYMTVALMPEPDLLTVNRYIEHMKKFRMEPTDRHLWTTSWLTLGSIGFKVSKWNRMLLKDLEDEITVLTMRKEDCNIPKARQSLEKRIDELRNKVTEIGKLYETVEQEIIMMVENLFKNEKKEFRMLALKVISNLGFDHFLPLLEKLALDKTEGVVIRQEAMDCLMRHIRERVNMEKVRSILLPIYFDFTEPEEMRLTAFFTVMQAMPSKPELEMIAKSLYEEPSRNVGSFVWDTMVIYSNTSTTCSCVKSLAHNATLALRYARSPEENFRYSSFNVYRYFDEIRKQGFTTTTGIWFSPKERLPTTIASCTQMTTFGRSFWLAGVEFRGQGMDALYETFYKNPQFAALKEMLSPKFKRSVSESEEHIEEIKEKLDVEPRDTVMPEGTLEFSFLDQIVFYFDFEPFLDLNHETLSKESPKSKTTILQKKVLKAIPEMLNVFSVIKRFFNTDRSFYLPLMRDMVPTEMGLPLYLNYDWLGSIRMEGDMTMHPDIPRHAEGSVFSMLNLMFNFKPSGFMESQITMMVDARFFQSGTTTRITNFMDMPMTLTLDGDLTKSKLHMKMTDMTPEMPFVYEAYTEAFFQWIPFLASKYPQPMDKKEILITADSNMETYSYEVGKYFFGFEYTIEGQWTRPKSWNVEQFPLCGKRTMYIKFNPIDSKEFDIYFQHIREVIRDGSEAPEKGSWISDMFSSFFSSNNEEIQPQAKDMREPVLEEPFEPFISLGARDLTMQYLERKFENDTKLLESGLKCGMAITVTSPRQTPEYKMQFTTFYQMDFKGLNHFYTMDLTHFTPEDPQRPWRMVTSTKMSLPSTVIEPSSLLDNEYQRQVQDQINRELQREDIAGFDFNYYIMINSVDQLLFSELRGHQHADIQELINHVLEQSVSQQLEEVEALVQDQRRIESEARVLRDSPIDLDRVDDMFDELERISKRSENVWEKVEQIFTEIKNPEVPQESVMVQYLLISQTNTLNELNIFLKKLKVVKYSDINARFENLSEMLYNATHNQLKLSLVKQSIEKQRAGMDIEPSEINIHTRLIEVEKKLITVLDKTVERKTSGYEILPKELVAQFNSIIRLGQGIVTDLNVHFASDPKLDKMVRVKMAEVLLQMTQVIQILDTRIAEINTMADVNSLSPMDKTKYTEQATQIYKLKGLLNGLVEAYAGRILLAVNVEKERKYLLSTMTPEMQNKIKFLNGITARHMELLEMLYRPPADRLNEQWLQQVVGKVIDVNGDLHNIISNEVFIPSSIPKMSPVLIKCLRELTDQLEIFELVHTLLHEKIKIEAANSKNLGSLESLRTRVWELTEDTYNLIDRASRQYHLLPIDALPENGKRGSPSMPSLVKQSVAVDAEYLHLKSEIGKLSRELTQDPNDMASPRLVHPSEHPLKVKEHLYKTVRRISQLQKNTEALHKVVRDELTKRPESESLHELRTSLEKRQEQLRGHIQSIEQVLKEMSTKDTTLLQPLQTLQQVKDKLQRYQHAYTVETLTRPSKSKSQIPAKDSLKPGQPRKEELLGPRDFMSEIRAEVSIVFGPEGEPKKTIFVKFIGSKTLQQLMWERDQIQPSKQAPIMKKYLADKTFSNDKTALEYGNIKSEINSFKHMHFFCTYEETLPFPLRNYMFRMQQMIKYYFYKEAEVSLPRTEVYPPNQFEFVMDFDNDDQWMSMRLDTSYEVMRVDFLSVPSWFRTMVYPPTMRFKENIITRLVWDAPGSCYITPRRIKTFDGERFMPELGSKPCETVLAMDCSPNHEFVVTRTPLSAGSQKITALTKEYIIEIERDVKTGEVEVYVNHEPVDFSKTPIKIKTAGSPLLIKKVRRDWVMVYVPHIGVYVDSDGERADIRIGHYHKGRLCGLCGDMDGSRQNDFTGPKKVLYPEPQSMAATYMIQSDTCDAKNIQKELKVPEIRDHSSWVMPLMETAVMVPKRDSISLICFSTTPVKMCPPNTEPQQEVSRTVGYHCLKSGRQARRLRQEAQLRVLYEMQGTSKDQHAVVNEPAFCRRI